MTKKELNKILKNGGASLKNGKVKILKSGFMASYKDHESIIKLEKNKSVILQLVNDYIKTFKRDYIGLWLDNGLLYIDVSKRFNTKKECLTFAKENKQLAIYNNKLNMCVSVN